MNNADKIYKKALLEIKKSDCDTLHVLKLLKRANKEGSIDACYALSTWYLHGTNVEQNTDKAIRLLRKCANENHTLGLYDLAVCYEEGTGVVKDPTKAFQFYLRSSFGGDKQSIYELGRMLYYGIGVEKNRELSKLFLEIADELEVN